jgi:hypothetical protein
MNTKELHEEHNVTSCPLCALLCAHCDLTWLDIKKQTQSKYRHYAQVE